MQFLTPLQPHLFRSFGYLGRPAAPRSSGHRPRLLHSFFRGALLPLLLFCLLFAFGWAGPLHQVSYAQQQAVAEYELKAVYLYNFLRFVQWPEGHKPLARDGSLVIGVVGESPFGNALEELKADVRRSGMKPVSVLYFGPYSETHDLKNCHLLFVSATERKNYSRIISALEGAPVLTVAETEGFLSSGGMIALVPSHGKIRWMINRTQADRAGLHLNAQLLSIAVKVVGGP